MQVCHTQGCCRWQCRAHGEVHVVATWMYTKATCRPLSGLGAFQQHEGNPTYALPVQMTAHWSPICTMVMLDYVNDLRSFRECEVHGVSDATCMGGGPCMWSRCCCEGDGNEHSLRHACTAVSIAFAGVAVTQWAGACLHSGTCQPFEQVADLGQRLKWLGCNYP